MFERFSRTRAKHGDTEERQQYPDASDYQDPQAVADPHTIEDDTQDSLLERVANNWVPILAFGLLGIALLILLGVYFGRYFITFITNPWTIRVAAVVTIFLTGVKMGISKERAAVSEETELTLDAPEGESATFRGEYRTADGAGYPIFVPYKGNRGILGGSPEPFTVGDLSRSLTNANGIDPETEARIRLLPALTTIHATDRGTRITVQTAGLRPDPHGSESNLEAKPPDTADEETVMEVMELLDALKEELSQKDKQMQILRRQRDEAQQMARENFEEYQKRLDRNVDTIAKILPSSRTGRSQTDGEDPVSRDRDDPRAGDPLAAERLARNGDDG